MGSLQVGSGENRGANYSSEIFIFRFFFNNMIYLVCLFNYRDPFFLETLRCHYREEKGPECPDSRQSQKRQRVLTFQTFPLLKTFASHNCLIIFDSRITKSLIFSRPINQMGRSESYSSKELVVTSTIVSFQKKK